MDWLEHSFTEVNFLPTYAKETLNFFRLHVVKVTVICLKLYLDVHNKAMCEHLALG